MNFPETAVLAVIQLVLILFAAPLLQGMIKKTKARLQGRTGPRLLQPYYDLFKYMKKDAVLSKHASWLTVATPYLVFASVLTAGLLVPTFMTKAPLAMLGDVILIIYAFVAARFFTAITALDAGGAFGGMGSSREMALSAIAEPALLLALFSLMLSSGTTSLEGVLQALAANREAWLDPAYMLAFLAMLIVVIAETGRIPVDNPDTHLELTMIHEGMLLEYSGRYLAFMLWAAQMKQLLLLSLFVNLFFPWGIAASWRLPEAAAALALYLLKLALAGVLLAFIETFYAKIRLFKVPKLLASSMLLSLMAIVIRIVQ